MAEQRRTQSKPVKAKPPPAKSVETREQQLTMKAMKLAEKKIEDGTASSQLICQFVKAGSTREQLEKERLKRENRLLRAKVEQLASQSKNEALLERAIAVFKEYAGEDEGDTRAS